MEMTPVLETPNESIKKSNVNHLEGFSLIWLNNNENDVDIQSELRNIINHIETFDDVEECKNYIENTSENDRLVLVTNGEFGRQIVPSIHQLKQISSIYINSEDKQWTNDFPTIKGIHAKMDELVSQIHKDHKNPRKIEEPVWVNMFTTISDTGKSTTGINGQFAFSQLLLDCLLRLKSNENDRNELISYCEKEYEGNQNELNHLDEFQRSYSPDNVLWWYTRESFFYKTLNAALRKQNIHMIYLYRSFIIDIQNQLKNHQCQCSTRVYRCQLMSIDELNYLKNSVGQYVSVNSFLSASLQKEIAIFLLGDTNHQWIGLEKVLFEMDADPKVVTTKPFADISQFSDFIDELEVLFMLGSIFRLNSIIRDDENQIWIIQMCLCSDDEHNLKQILMDMKNEIGDGETNLCILGTVVRRMGHFDLAKKYYYRCLDELSQNDPLLLTVYKDLAEIASQQKDYEEYLRLRHILVKIKEEIQLNDNEIETSEINKLTDNDTIQKRKSKNYIRCNRHLKLLIYSCILILMIGTGIFTLRYIITKKPPISPKEQKSTITSTKSSSRPPPRMRTAKRTTTTIAASTSPLLLLSTATTTIATSTSPLLLPTATTTTTTTTPLPAATITTTTSLPTATTITTIPLPTATTTTTTTTPLPIATTTATKIKIKTTPLPPTKTTEITTPATKTTAKTTTMLTALSFNQPKFCPIPDWNPFGITFTNKTTLGKYCRNLFINTNNTVYTVDRDEKQILMWINNSINPNKIISANFFDSKSIFVTNNGNIYYDDGMINGRVDKKISNTNTFVNVMDVDSPCYGLFIDINDTLYCSMFLRDKIIKRWLDDSELISTTAAGTGRSGFASNELHGPMGIFVDLNFDLYVADCYNHRIQLFKHGELNGTTIVGKGSPNNIISLYHPTGIVLDADKYLFIVDYGNHRIIRSGSNDIRCIIGCDRKGSQSHQLSSPTSLSFDSYGNIFITDSSNHRIQKFDFLLSSCGKFKIIG
ncbi:unnamed protein product [Adineta steineri]|uniref:ADP ribosyltransferase domain-containing protein n=1 Tax=Adineta steineri TaxID=433720 RepID=A0A813ZPL1_9BILA|nr:unnamed protein product [Adineta steineri]CAF1210158.1 unnamed protein product [Adineta steineri]